MRHGEYVSFSSTSRTFLCLVRGHVMSVSEEPKVCISQYCLSASASYAIVLRFFSTFRELSLLSRHAN